MRQVTDSSAFLGGKCFQISYAMGALLLVVYGLVVANLMPVGTLAWPIKALLLIFLLLPPPLCFLLVRTYTEMVEDERVSMLTEAWDHSELEFASSDEYREAQRRIQEAHVSDEKTAKGIVLDGLRHFVLRRHPRLARILAGVQKGQDRGEVARSWPRRKFEWLACTGRPMICRFSSSPSVILRACSWCFR